jgi:peptidoglycan glycosyltransferase
MALITATVANGGIMMKPYVVSRVESSDGNVIRETNPEIYDELMTLEEAEILSGYMHETVLTGTGTALSWNSYSVAGKTGSAEYETGGVTGTHSWFVGFSNVDDPDIVVAVIAEDGGTGSSTAVPIAQSVFDAYYYS